MVRGGLLGDMLSHLLLCDCAELVPGGMALVLATLLSLLVARSTSKIGKEMSGETSCCKKTCCKIFSGKDAWRGMLRAMGCYCIPLARFVDSWAPSLAFVAFWAIFSSLVKPAEAVVRCGHCQDNVLPSHGPDVTEKVGATTAVEGAGVTLRLRSRCPFILLDIL